MKFVIVKIPGSVFLNQSFGSLYSNLVSLLTFYLKEGLACNLSNLISYYVQGDLSKKVAVYCFNTSHFKEDVDLNFVISNLNSVLGQTSVDFGLTEDVSKWLSEREITALPVEHVGRA
jgi:hypothetical protein